MADFTKLNGYWVKDKQGRFDLTDIKTYIGYTDSDILGLCADFENNTFTRLSAATDKTAGADFNTFPMYSGRRKCNLSDSGIVNAWYGDTRYTEDGSNGQVMVWQPKFYYKVVPLKLELQEYDTWEAGKSYSVGECIKYGQSYYKCTTANNNSQFTPSNWTEIPNGLKGYHILKANYYITVLPKDGFKVHPAFIDENGNEVSGIYISAYGGCVYDVSESEYRKYDSWDVTENGGDSYTINSLSTYTADVTASTGDKLSSVANMKPASGEHSNLTRANTEVVASNRGTGWHLKTIQVASMEQLLFAIEYGSFNSQTVIGQGVVSYSYGSDNECVFTGSTASLGNGSGVATSSARLTSGGTYETNANDGYKSVCYRGSEDDWGNIWDFIEGVNVWGNGNMYGGEPYICSDYNFTEEKKNDNYEGAGFTLANKNDGYVKYFGYGNPDYDWLFMTSKTGGTSSLPVGDGVSLEPNTDGYRIIIFGGNLFKGNHAGEFSWLIDSVSGKSHTLGGRLIYVPQVG